MVLIGSLLILTACGEGVDADSSNSPFSGYDGIILGLDENDAGITQMFPTSPGFFQVFVENKGPVETDVTLISEGIDLNVFDVEQDPDSPIFLPKSTSQRSSTPEFANFDVSLRDEDVFGFSEGFDFGVKVVACYPYGTIFSSAVCLDGNADYRQSDDEVCDSQYSISSGGGQGSPVYVSDITYDALKRGPDTVEHRLTMFFQNGKGVKIYLPEYDACGSDKALERASADRIRIDKVILGTEDITASCHEPRDGIWMGRGLASVTCSLTRPSQHSNFQSPLRVEASYYVKDSIAKRFHLNIPQD
jgi:hypothetical protein